MLSSAALPMIRVYSCPDICFAIVNLLTSPLIIYSKFVWSNLLYLIGQRLENI